MKKTYSYIIIMINSLSILKCRNVTEGKIEPLPLAVTKFNYTHENEENYSTNITNIISNNLGNTILFKLLSSESFLQSEMKFFNFCRLASY